MARMKEFYTQKETDLRQSNRMEVENLKASHQTELESLKQTSKQELDVIRNRFGDKFSDREKQHVKEIEALKEIYEKKLRQATKES